ncbi:hypothetical protein EM308_13575 [Flavobacterium gilvum]|uniref:Lipocalin-like domain-containing protein n=2 Tax=Flavobacterium gilvum TaxID=1492737 RepID=A0AAC9I418_9FLAO|nr:hypothetical protein EM308_13575 [Flavobacterium gilvum]
MIVITTFVSCGSDDYKTGAKDVADTVKDGTWRVGYFYDSGVEKTKSYEGYNFTFGENTTLTAIKGIIINTGIWSVAKSTNDADIYSTIFKITFASPDIFAQLTGDWKVIENTGTSLKLKDDSKGDTQIDYLNFEKN